MYITDVELRALASNERLDGMQESTTSIFIGAAEELIDRYCGHPIVEPVPFMVKVVAAELVNVMLQDSTKHSENKGDYSYSANDKAYTLILGKLDAVIDAETAAGRKSVNVYVV